MDERTPPSPEYQAIGRRLQEIRAGRKMSQRAVAELAGYSASYLCLIENGERIIDKRSTLEAFANALRVAPADLAGGSYSFPPANPIDAEAVAGLAKLDEALSWQLGNSSEVPVQPWPQIAARIEQLDGEIRPRADYNGQLAVLPQLIEDLHATYTHDTDHQRDALIGMMSAYHAAATCTKNLRQRGMPTLAAMHARIVAEALDDPAWLGLAAWLRGNAAGSSGRSHQYEASRDAARNLEPMIGRDDRCLQVYGQLHMNAALAAAVLGDAERTWSHAEEADDAAGRLAEQPPGSRGFGSLYFCPDNVGVWRVSLATELGERGRVLDFAQRVPPKAIPSAARQATLQADVGRVLAHDRKTGSQAIAALSTAEATAPQYVRNNALVRETVIHLMRRTPRDSREGRELRGLAHRMGIPV